MPVSMLILPPSVKSSTRPNNNWKNNKKVKLIYIAEDEGPQLP